MPSSHCPDNTFGTSTGAGLVLALILILTNHKDYRLFLSFSFIRASWIWSLLNYRNPSFCPSGQFQVAEDYIKFYVYIISLNRRSDVEHSLRDLRPRETRYKCL